MELKRHFNFKIVFITVYIFCFLVYILVGLKPAEATEYNISGELSIPSIDLVSDVTDLELNGNKLDTPDTIVGSFSNSKNKTFLIGHSSTVFTNLEDLKLGDSIFYQGKTYQAVEKSTLRKSAVSMNKILKAEEEDTLIIMTCAGEDLGDNDFSHRLIIKAILTD